MNHTTNGNKPTNKAAGAVALVLALCVVALSVVLVSCNDKKEEYVPQYQKETTNITPYYEKTAEGVVLPTSGSRHDITVIEGGGVDAPELLGTWVDEHQATRYMFDGQGRGIMLTSVANYTFVYSAQNGRLGIDIDIDEKAEDIEYSYTVSGDKLTMTRGDQTYVFTKE